MNKVVLHIMGMSCNKFGGLERFLVRLMEETNDKFILVFNNTPKSSNFVKAVDNSGGEIITLNLLGWGFVKHIFNYIKILKKYKPSIVHFHFGNNVFLYAFLAKLFGVQSIIKTEHNCIVDTTNGQVTSKSQIPRTTRFLSFNGLGYYLIDCIVFVSEYTQKQFTKVYGNSLNSRFRNIYLGVEQCPLMDKENKQKVREELNLQKDDLVVATTLFSDPIKGVDVLINSIPFIKRKNIKFVIIGMDKTSDFTREMHYLAKQLKVEDSLVWVGITDKVYHYLSIADIYVQPSRSEALGLAAVEAMSMNLPVIASKVGGLTELTPCLFKNGDSRQLALLLNELISNDEKRHTLGKQLFEKYLTDFQLGVGVEKYKKLYEEL